MSEPSSPPPRGLAPARWTPLEHLMELGRVIWELPAVRPWHAGLERVWSVARRNDQAVFFSGGFIFDALTLDRIDAWLDLTMQALYVAAVTAILLFQRREELGLWKPPAVWDKYWRFAPEVRHFFFGGLLSACFIFYSKSGGGGQAWFFFLALLVLLVFNELPAARRWGPGMRLALYTFCLAAFLIYFVPVVVGRMGDGVFTLSMILTAGCVWALAWNLCQGEGQRRSAALGLIRPSAAVLAGLCAFYFLRWIPPVPMSLKQVGIYHSVERRGADFIGMYEKRGWWDFFRKEDAPFLARPGDELHCFVRIFAPTRFTHQISLHWEWLEGRQWTSQDNIPLPIRGGRAAGWRGYGAKARYQPGRWRVSVQTEDGRVLGQREFEVRADAEVGGRLWKTAKL